MLFPNATLIEILQLTLAAAGVGLAFWRLWIAIENGLLITTTESTDLRRVIAETQVLGELFRLGAQGCLLALGAFSILLPPPHGNGAPELPEDLLNSFLVRAGLITLTILLVLDSLVQEVRRRQFLASVHVGENEGLQAQGLRQTADLTTLITQGTDAAKVEADTINKKLEALSADKQTAEAVEGRKPAAHASNEIKDVSGHWHERED